jgi:hypothetical protein
LEIFKRYSQYWKYAKKYGWVKSNTPYSPSWCNGICGKIAMSSFGLKTPGDPKQRYIKKTDNYSIEKKVLVSPERGISMILDKVKDGDVAENSNFQFIQNLKSR